MTIAIMARIPETVNEYIPCAFKRREIDGELCIFTTVKSTSRPIKTVPMVNHVASCEMDLATNAFVDDGAAAA